MAVARTSDEAFDHRKRWLLESRLERAGAVWGNSRRRGPMSGFEALQRLWAHLDGLARRDGSLDGISPDDVEAIAGWQGEPGVFWREIVSVGWVDDLGEGRYAMHHFAHLNEKAIAARVNGGQGGRPPKTQRVTQPVTQSGTQPGTQPVTQTGTQREPRSAPPQTEPGTFGGNPRTKRGPNELTEGLTPADLEAELRARNGKPNPEPNPEPNAKQSGSGSGSGFFPDSEDKPKRLVSSGATPDDPPKPKGIPPSPEAEVLAGELLGAIRTHAPAFRGPPKLDGWARAIDLAIRIDGRTPDELRRVIAYAHRSAAGSFWRSNLLSGDTLRRQAERLLIDSARAVGSVNGVRLGAADLERVESELRRAGR